MRGAAAQGAVSLQQRTASRTERAPDVEEVVSGREGELDEFGDELADEVDQNRTFFPPDGSVCCIRVDLTKGR